MFYMAKWAMPTTVLSTMSLFLSMNIAMEYKIQIRRSEFYTGILAKQFILNFFQCDR